MPVCVGRVGYAPPMSFRARTPGLLAILLACPAAWGADLAGAARSPDASPDGAGPAAERADADQGLLDALFTRSSYTFRSFTAYWDNDGTYPNLVRDTDRFYTSGQGIEFGFGFEPADPSRFAPGWEDPRFGVGISLKQRIFTASDIAIADPDPDDHPYSGWLTLGFSFQRADANRHDHFGLDLGIVGPQSYAEDIQKWVHTTWPDEVYPEGWGTQLKNEPALNITYQRTWRTDRAEIAGLKMDMLPAVRLDAGNVFLRARGEATVRLGWNLPDDFGPASFLGIKDHTGGGWDDPDNPWSVYGYARASVDAVGRNIFIDGNTFASSRSASREPFVARATFGVMARYRCVELGWAQTLESDTFRAQPNGHTWGSIVLNIQCRF